MQKLWDRGIIAAQTAEKGHPSIYDPSLTDGEIREMEMSCVTGAGTELPRTLSHVRRFYRDFGTVIGASEGQKTEYVFVQYTSDGTVHGYPATSKYLESRGANL